MSRKVFKTNLRDPTPREPSSSATTDVLRERSEVVIAVVANKHPTTWAAGLGQFWISNCQRRPEHQHLCYFGLRWIHKTVNGQASIHERLRIMPIATLRTNHAIAYRTEKFRDFSCLHRCFLFLAKKLVYVKGESD